MVLAGIFTVLIGGWFGLRSKRHWLTGLTLELIGFGILVLGMLGSIG